MGKLRKKAKKVFIPNAENDFLPTFLKPRTLFILAVVLLVIKFLIFSWFFYLPKTSQFAVVTASRLVELANQERVALGLNPLQVNQQLVQAAYQKAQDMVNNNYFDHYSHSGLTPWHWLDTVGYKYVAAGENLARDFADSSYLHQAWMNSLTHKKNIINKNFKEIGIAVIEGNIDGRDTILAVQFFALSTKAPTKVGAKVEEKKTAPPTTASDTSIELFPRAEVSEDEEQSFLKGPLVFAQRQNLERIIEKPKNVLSAVKENSESIVQKFYFIILGIVSLVLLLTIFINIRVQYPKIIFSALIVIILIAAIALFNGQEFLNRAIEVL